MRLHIAILLIFALLSACVTTAPLNNSPFSAIDNIGQLEGAYKNKGDGGPTEKVSLYLSRVLWPDEKTLNHESIDIIEVKKQTEDTLIVNALQGSATVKTAKFTYGKDFKIEEGIIVLKSEVNIAGFKAGEPLVGFYAGGTQIGLDEKGHGKFHSSGTAAGLAYMFLPIAVSGSQDVRFYRIGK